MDTAGDLRSGDSQSDIIAFLSCPASYPGTVAQIGRIDTHGAIVFLAGSKAYKLKRAVQLSYFDFSTIAQRAAACRNELERNRQAAPGLYLGCIPITRGEDGSLALDGAGETVDWLVVMNQFEQMQLFDNLALQEKLDPELMEPLAAVIAAYHAKSVQHHEVEGDKSVARVIAQIISAMHGAPDDFKVEKVV